MKKTSWWAMLLSLFIALTVSVLQAVTAAPDQIDGLAAVAAADSEKTWAAVYEKNKINFYLLGNNGVAQKSFSIFRKSGELMAQIAYMTTDEQGRVYFIKQYTGAADGKYDTRQELVVYTPKLLPFGRFKTIRLDNKEDTENVLYSHIHISTSLILTGVSGDGDKIVRKAYDIDSLKDTGGSTIKNLRSYPADSDQGVYKVVTSGTDVVYVSKSGKVFLSEEHAENPVQIYPEAQTQLSSYASFICGNATGQVIIGEQNSGNILRLYTTDSRVEYLAEGGRAFGTFQYTGEDVLEMSFRRDSDTSYVAVVQGKNTGASELIACDKGEYFLITRISKGFIATFKKIFGNTVLYLLILLMLIGAVMGARVLVTQSRKIFVKLIFASIPLLILALTLFGAYSYTSYQSSLRSTYETKVEDQGNLLRALFSSTSFDKIISPQLYSSTEYTYLRTQMGTRDVHTGSAYYVDGKLYTGVDWNLPCLYPFGIHYSTTAQELYRAAALTGKQQSGAITDRFGERIACITPVGSSSGNTVFLLETSIFQAEINRQTTGFMRNYLIIALLCLISACALLLITFLRILRPLGDIIEGLDEFSKGNRTVRLVSTTNDELADISRVFNKMAKDIDIQIYNLRTMGETYYRFVPQQIFRLLGKNNLADIELGSAVEGKFSVLVANLYPRQGRMDLGNIQELTNRFFAIVHKVAGENGATLLSDSVGLRDLRIICPDGDAAVEAAIEAIAGIDEHNAKSPIFQRLDVSFFLHHTQICFCICGDGQRYVPAMISSELDSVLLQCEDFRRLSSRLIVTGESYGNLNAGKYFHRFIGYAGEGDEDRCGLYDFYDSSSPSLIRLLNDTRGAFDKALELFHQKRYYDAKNLFAVVLRENQYDNVARHYIFRCEKNL